MYDAMIRYAKRLSQRLFGIPGDVPSRFQWYLVASNFMFVFALVGHSTLSPFHYILGHAWAFWINLICVPVDLLCLQLNHRRRFATAFGIWVSVMTLHTVISCLAYGWGSGFHYYIVSMTVFVFISPWDRRINCALLIVLMTIYFWLNIHDHTVPSLIALTPSLKSLAQFNNMAVNFIILAYLAYHFTRAAEGTQYALEESEKTLKTTLAASPVGIAQIKNREILWANDTLVQLLGYETDTAMKRGVTNYFPDPAAIGRIEQQAYSIGQAAIDLPDIQLVRRDGTQFPCHMKVRPIVPRDPTKGSIVAVMDTSALKAAEKQQAILQAKCQRAEKMEAVGTLAGGVAHDLNNILSGILSYPELLLMDLSPDSPLKKPIETIQRCGEKAAAIVQDLLTLARRGVQVKQPVGLNAVVRDYMASPECEMLRQYHPLVDIEANLSEDLAPVAGSSVHLAKTLMNLVSNAAEAMTAGGRLEIKTENRMIPDTLMGYEIIPPGHYAVLSVTDTGPGISAECLERIFEPFYTKKVMGRSGTGLGLAVVWGTVKDSGGFVDVISQPGQGTQFELFLPVTQDAFRGIEPSARPEAFLGCGEHVLVVDDVEEQRIIAAGMLTKLGYRVDAVASGEAAVTWMQAHTSDLLLLDMIMDPGINGLETYRRILSDHPHQKAIIASGYSETQLTAEALALGRASYLKKPYNLVDLARTVKQILGHPLPSGSPSS